MSVNKVIFLNTFKITNIPEWTCPTCQKGILRILNNIFHLHESALSRLWRKDELDEVVPENIHGVFTGVLYCSTCDDNVTITGKYNVNEGEEFDSQYLDYRPTYFELLTPIYFNPPLHIFPININIPSEISKEIVSAFKLYWSDTPSCVNKLRIVIELIMDDMNIEKKDGNRFLSLHERIKLFEDANPKYSKSLYAIKWIGNAGSHTNDNIPKSDIIDTLEILEYVLNMLYDTEEKRIAELTEEINNKWAPEKYRTSSPI